MFRGSSASVAVLCLVAALPAAANDGGQLCFARAYTAAYLAEEPDQHVAEMPVLLTPYGANDTVAFDTQIRVMMRDRFGMFFTNQGDCFDSDNDGRLDCGIACDAGPFAVDLNADGTATLRNEGRGLWFTDGCGESEEGETVFVAPDGPNRAFVLHAMPREACPTDLWAPYLD